MTGVATLPGFAESLALLVERERYSLTDIGLMFGVSRERMRQLVKRAGLTYPADTPRGLHGVRVWDDATHCFAPVLLSTVQRQQRQTVQDRKRDRKRAHALEVAETIRTRMTLAALMLARTLGREPSCAELATLFGNRGANHHLARWPSTGYGRVDRNRQRAAAFRRATGFTGRPVGIPGHLTHGNLGAKPLCEHPRDRSGVCWPCRHERRRQRLLA